MSLEPCNVGPCPVLKPSGRGLQQQPSRCYNCEYKLARGSTSSSSESSRHNSCRSSQESLTSASSVSSSPPIIETHKSSVVCHPLPGVAVQPTGTARHGSRPSVGRSFSFACNKSGHWITPHYSGLPVHLPHQDHSCPPCQLEQLRANSDLEVTREAQKIYPTLKDEMLVRDGRVWDPEIQKKPSLASYIEEKRTEEREMWLHVTRKWTQDLRKRGVLVAEEDGLGLFG